MGRMESSWLGNGGMLTMPCNHRSVAVSGGGCWHRPLGGSRAGSGPVKRLHGARVRAAGEGARLLSALPLKAAAASVHRCLERSLQVARCGPRVLSVPCQRSGALVPPGIASQWPLPKLRMVIEGAGGCWAALMLDPGAAWQRAGATGSTLDFPFPLIDGKGGCVREVRSAAAAPRCHRAPAPRRAILSLPAVCLGSTGDPSLSPP